MRMNNRQVRFGTVHYQHMINDDDDDDDDNDDCKVRSSESPNTKVHLHMI